MSGRSWSLGLLGVVLCMAAVGCKCIPPNTQQADAAAIRKADAVWMAAAQTKSADAWVAFYSDDAVILPPNDKMANTKDAIHKAIADMFSLPGVAINWTPTKVEVAKSGELGYLYGTYQMGWDQGGKRMSDVGKMVEVWGKQSDGSWKCVADIWNSDLMPAAPEATASAKKKM